MNEVIIIEDPTKGIATNKEENDWFFKSKLELQQKNVVNYVLLDITE